MGSVIRDTVERSQTLSIETRVVPGRSSIVTEAHYLAFAAVERRVGVLAGVPDVGCRPPECARRVGELRHGGMTFDLAVEDKALGEVEALIAQTPMRN